jgi:pilus assembly protein CpaD
MKNRKLAYLSLCLGLTLAGCNPDAPAWNPADRSPQPMKVEFVRLQHPAAFTSGSDKLAGGESEKLMAFLSGAQVSGEDHVYFQAAPGDKLAAMRIGALTREVGQQGVGASMMPPASDVPPNELRIIVERYVVTPPDCPNWTKDPTSNHENTVASNFGCATVTNFGLQVADPRDLVVGRTMGPEEGDPAIAAINRYRAGKPKGLKDSGGGGGGFAPLAIQMPGGGP